MGHPPGGENDPDDRMMYTPLDGYQEDADGGGVSGEGGPGQGQDGGWSQDQLQVRASILCQLEDACSGSGCEWRLLLVYALWPSGCGLADLVIYIFI